MRCWSRLSTRRYASTLRNLGIIAHIDAGKTTTTERMLYYAGHISRLGNVDAGDTVTDFLPAERERGITIQAAAVSFNWQNSRVNLIDTPGHADFGFEVQRSLRVLDGAVTILDGVAGVEALTETVWGHANRLNLPRMIFVNKMDRPGAGFSRTVREVVSKLHTPVVLLTLPLWEDMKFVGIIDVLRGKEIRYNSEDGKSVEIADPGANSEALKAREVMIDTLSEFSEEVVEEYLAGKVQSSTLEKAIRDTTASCKLTPVLCGASFRNIGVQPLLDSIVSYLPPPKQEKGTVQALAFKVKHDAVRGTLVYVRVYQGILKGNVGSVYNTVTRERERVSRLLRIQADEPTEISEITCGDIGVLVGTKGIRTGDTLVAHPQKRDGINFLSKKDRELSLMPIPVPPPVFTTRITPRARSDIRPMEQALSILLREDPSLRLSFDEEAGQWLLSGLGELHLEIARNRLVHDLGARIEMGSPMITFKETLASPAPAVIRTAQDETGSTKVIVETAPCKVGEGKLLSDQNYVTAVFAKHPSISKEEVERAVSVGILPVLAQGGKLGNQALFGLQFRVKVEISPESQQASHVSTLVRLAVAEAISLSSSFVLLEPIMQVSISAPAGDIGKVMNDISGVRRGHVTDLGSEDATTNSEWAEKAASQWVPLDHTLHLSRHAESSESRLATVNARVPLRTLVGYLSVLRSMTNGRGSFQMTFNEFDAVPSQDVESVIEENC